MKKYLLLVIPVILIFTLIACDSTNESTSSETDKINESSNSVVSSGVTTDTSNNDESSEAVSAPNVSVDESQDPDAVVNATISDISVALIGIDELESAGFKADSSFSKTVSLTVKGKKSVLDALDSSDISAVIDVSGIIENGDIECMINYVLPEGVTYVSASDLFANVKIEKVSAEIIPPVVEDVRIVEGVLISGTRAMEQFGGTASSGQTTATKLNTFKSAVGDDVNVYVLPAPVASAFYAPEGYERSIANHQNCFYGMKDALVNVEFVDTITALSAHTNEDIYFRTDHHWQALGAYYSAKEFAKVAGTSFDDISTFKVQSSEGMLGSFYTTYTHDAVLGNNPDTMVWYEPTRTHKVEYYSRDYYKNPISDKTLFSGNSGYTKFIYGDSYTTHITSNVGNGRKLLLFKDSYGNALAPFLISSFDEVYIADYRYFMLNAKDFIDQEGITDVCFELAAFTVASNNKSEYIIKLINY